MKNKIKEFDEIKLLNNKIPLPLTIIGLIKSEKRKLPKSSKSSYYQTDLYYTVVFYKPISKIFSYEK